LAYKKGTTVHDRSHERKQAFVYLAEVWIWASGVVPFQEGKKEK
jgi:hypothetical protein